MVSGANTDSSLTPLTSLTTRLQPAYNLLTIRVYPLIHACNIFVRL